MKSPVTQSFFFALAMLMPLVGRGQAPEYNQSEYFGPGPGPQLPLISWGERLPDLYYWDTNWYDYNWSQYGPITMLKTIPFYSRQYIGRPCVTNAPLKVIGIAAPIWIMNHNAFDTVMEDRFPEFFQLYQKEGSNYFKRAETRWDTATPEYWMELANTSNTAPSAPLFSYDTGRLFKAYFEKPVIVHDTFFVGGTTWNNCPFGINADFPDVPDAKCIRLATVYAKYQYTPDAFDVCYHSTPNPQGYLRKFLSKNSYYYSLGPAYENLDTTATYLLPPGGDGNLWTWLAFFAIIDTDFVYEACSVPTGLQLLGVHDLAAAVTWDAGTDTMWEVSLVQTGDSPDEGFIVETTDNYYYFDSLDTAMVYEIRVRALCDGDIYGPWSEPLQFLSLCRMPDDFHVVSTNVGKVVLQWADIPEAAGWETEVAPEGTPLDSGAVMPAPMYFTVRNGLDTGTWHWARVRTVCSENQVSYWTDTVMFYVPGDGSGPDNPDTTNDINPVEQYTYLMPNPAKEEVTVMSSFRVKKVELFAADGKLLQAQEVNSAGTRLSLEGLPAGVYFVRVTTSAGVTTKRLVVE